MGRHTTVGTLAAEIGVDADDILIVLWENGHKAFDGPGDHVSGGQIACVKAAFGLESKSSLTSPSFWQQQLGLDEAAFTALLGDLGVHMSEHRRKLPKGSIRKLRSQLRIRRQKGEAAVVSPVAREAAKSIPEFEWTTVGHTRDLRYLADKEVEQIHFAIARDFALHADPISPVGVRDVRLLASAVERPKTSLDGQMKYPTVEMACAALMHSLVFDHPFHNGNKRTGLVSALVFLDENGFVLTCDQDEVFEFMMRLTRRSLDGLPATRDALSADREVMAASLWIAGCCRRMDKTERPIQWRRLKVILRGYGCSFAHPGVGNRLNIQRTIESRSRFHGRMKHRPLNAQVHFRGDGSEADRSEVAEIRERLQLDPEHGVDSFAFYGGAASQADEWIDRYRQTLKLLARR